jgi:hypothetical protein
MNLTSFFFDMATRADGDQVEERNTQEGSKETQPIREFRPCVLESAEEYNFISRSASIECRT